MLRTSSASSPNTFGNVDRGYDPRMTRFIAAFAVSTSLSLLNVIPAQAQDVPRPVAQDDGAMMSGGCDSFTWDVSHELDVLGQPAKTIVAGTEGKKPMRLELDQHYTVKLAPQGTVKFAVKPGKATAEDGARAGVLSFHAPKAGRYRVSLTTAHWLDLVDGGLVVVSSAFQGQRGCEKVHKIVQFELSGNKDFVLQLSGDAHASLDVAITQVKTG
jgi:hypothetical protein